MNISLEEFINYNQSELDQIDPSFRKSIFTQYPDLSQLENTESKSFSQKLQENLNLKRISSPKTTISIPEIIKDLKSYPSNSQKSVDIKIGKTGFNLTKNNSVIEAKLGLSLPNITDFKSTLNDGKKFVKSLYRDSRKSIGTATKVIVTKGQNITNDVEDMLTDGKKLVKSLYGDSRKHVGTSAKTIVKKGQNVTNDVKRSVNNGKKLVNLLYGEATGPDIGEIYHNTPTHSPIYDFSEIKEIPKEVEITFTSNRNPYKLDPENISRTCTDLECTSYLTNRALDEQGSTFINQFNYRGSGWTMQSNIEKAGGQRITNIYDSDDIPKVFDKSEIIKYSNSKTSDPAYRKTLRDNLEPGDFVSLLYPKSGNFEKAWEESNGKMLSTHGGEIVEINGNKYVRDNVSGSLKYRPLNDVIEGKDSDGVRITGSVKINKINKSIDMSDIGITPNSEHVDNPKFDIIHNRAAYRALKAINNNRNMLQRINELSDEEYKTLLPLAHAIMYKDSKYGISENNDTYNFTSGRSVMGKVANDVKNAAFKVGLSDEESLGLGNINYRTNYSKNELTALGLDKLLDNKEVMESPEVSGVMTMDMVARTYKKVKSLLSDLPESIRNNDKLVKSLTAIAHNQGFDHIKEDIENYKQSKDENKLLQYIEFEYPKIVNAVSEYSNYNLKKDTPIVNISQYKSVPQRFSQAVVSTGNKNDPFKTYRRISKYLSDEELSKIDINKKNFDILALQKELSNRGYKLPKSTKSNGTFDGILGNETKNALLDYQSKIKTK